MNLTRTPAPGLTLAVAVGVAVFVLVVLGGVYAAGVSAQPKPVLAQSEEEVIK